MLFRRIIPLPLTLITAVIACSFAHAAAPLHQQIDALIEAGANNTPLAATADDAEFLRRIFLDFTGSIPTLDEARAFLADKSPDKRSKLIDQLITSDHYPRRMAELFHVMLMERRGDHAEWQAYLLESFKANKPWDQLAREILGPDPRNEKTRASAFFYSKRLEKYGENPTDYPGLTRDVGRLFLGMDLQCAQCHNHLTVRDYKQSDFQGLYAVYLNLNLHGGAFPAVSEKPMTKKLEFASVFGKEPKQIGPRVPGMPELDVPATEKGKEFAVAADKQKNLPPVPAFSPMARIAELLPSDANEQFARNAVNRLWFVMMGRGLVHPLDLHHKDNPPSHPQLLELLAKEFVAHKYDTRWLLRELALTKTYQRSSVAPSTSVTVATAAQDRFAVALERRLSSEQLLRCVLIATGEMARVSVAKPSKDSKDAAAINFDDLKKRFDATFAAEPKEPEEAVDHTLKGALFMRNDAVFLALLKPREGNLVDRLSKQTDAGKLAEDLYLCVLTRLPSAEENAEVGAFLTKRGDRKGEAIADLAWALLASAEFQVNH